MENRDTGLQEGLINESVWSMWSLYGVVIEGWRSRQGLAASWLGQWQSHICLYISLKRSTLISSRVGDLNPNKLAAKKQAAKYETRRQSFQVFLPGRYV